MGEHVNVVVNCRFLTRPVTGVERFAAGIVDALTELRDDLVLVAPAHPAGGSDRFSGIPIQRVGRHTGHRWEQVDLPRFLRSQGSPLLLSLANTGPMRYHEQVVVIHDVLHRRHPQAHSRAFRAWYAVLTPALIRSARGLVTVSEFSRGEIAELYGRAVAPNAVGPWIQGASRRPSTLPVDDFFLTVGSRSAHKDLATALAGFARYRREGGTAALAVVGGLHHSLRDAGTRAPREGVVELGRVGDEELAWLYHRARAFVFPSRYEGFGIPPLEAQAAGTPVVAADIPALREALTDASSMWFVPGDAAGLARAMGAVDREGMAGLIRAGRENVARFSWAASARTISGLIDSLQ
jgi:glycosyltransferase involved in cell wall biosynthesis